MTFFDTALYGQFLGTPGWMWLAFLTIVLFLLLLDLGVVNREHREIGVKESLVASAFYIGAGLLFGALGVVATGGRNPASSF